MASGTASRRRLGDVLFYGIVILLAYLVYLIFAPFLGSLAWAAVIVVVSYPVYEWMSRRWGATNAALACTAGVTLILIVPILFIMVAFVRQGVGAAQSIQMQVANGHWNWVNRVWDQIQDWFPSATGDDLTTTLEKYGETAAKFVAARLGTILKNTATFIFHLGVTILAMFYFFRDGHSMVERAREILPFESAHRNRMIEEMRSLIFASVTSSLAAAGAHGALGGLTFALTGVKAPIFWGVMMAFFSFVPVIGSSLIWVPIAISLFVSGHWGRGTVVIVVCMIIVGVVDNLLRPLFISGRAEMSGLVIFISVLGGIAVFGLLGVIMGPIIVASVATLLDVYAPPSESLGNT